MHHEADEAVRNESEVSQQPALANTQVKSVVAAVLSLISDSCFVFVPLSCLYSKYIGTARSNRSTSTRDAPDVTMRPSPRYRAAWPGSPSKRDSTDRAIDARSRSVDCGVNRNRRGPCLPVPAQAVCCRATWRAGHSNFGRHNIRMMYTRKMQMAISNYSMGKFPSGN
ncbi:hypothetical protein F4803DRAFT_100451 [Xylaria telfairii]|nr:hypothetical protein F4803DRAFT_100451 [Xylaria telfairii]